MPQYSAMIDGTLSLSKHKILILASGGQSILLLYIREMNAYLLKNVYTTVTVIA